VSADVSPDGVNAVQATQMLRDYFQQIAPEFPGYRLDFRGEFQEFEEAFQNVGRLFLIGLILIYLILGAQFRSYIQPLLVMCSIPFAFAGAMLYLLVSGYPFSIMVMYGMVALAGVVVNDSIVLIDFVNNARRRGASAYRAVLTAAKRRLRPIFLTTATTIFGLLPMALGVGGRSVVWIPPAGTIVVGLGMATFLILLIIPPLYLAIEDVRRFFGFSTPAISPAASEEPREVRVPRFG